jgi:hypothetical protein
MVIVVIGLIAVVTFLTTITLVVIGQEIHPVVAVLAFASIVYGLFRLFKARVTRF